jgi:hypothetical protein
VRSKEREAIESAITDPTASFWVQDILRTALERDPVDAANDLKVASRLMTAYVREMLGLQV